MPYRPCLRAEEAAKPSKKNEGQEQLLKKGARCRDAGHRAHDLELESRVLEASSFGEAHEVFAGFKRLAPSQSRVPMPDGCQGMPAFGRSEAEEPTNHEGLGASDLDLCVPGPARH